MDTPTIISVLRSHDYDVRLLMGPSHKPDRKVLYQAVTGETPTNGNSRYHQLLDTLFAAFKISPVQCLANQHRDLQSAIRTHCHTH